MAKHILIIGSPGSGKSVFSAALASAAGKAALKEDDFVKETVQYIRKEKRIFVSGIGYTGGTVLEKRS